MLADILIMMGQLHNPALQTTAEETHGFDVMSGTDRFMTSILAI
jgi:hypothetical protein